MVGQTLSDLFADDSALGLRAIFWWYDESHEDWRLYVVCSYCDDHGQKETYLRLRRNLEKAGLVDAIPLYRIVAARTDNRVATAVRKRKVSAHRYDTAAGPTLGLRVFDASTGATPTTSPSSSTGKYVTIPTRAFK